MNATRWSLALLVGLFAACAHSSQGRPIDRDKVRTIERGVTRAPDVRDLLGEPTDWRVDEDGTETWRYRHEAGPKGRILCDLSRIVILGSPPPDSPLACVPGLREQLTVVFDANGVVRRADYTQDTPEEPNWQRGPSWPGRPDVVPASTPGALREAHRD